MQTLEKLEAIREYKVVYQILFRNAGVAIQFYDPPDDFKAKGSDETWRNFLKINKFYPTIKEAIDAEYSRVCH